MPYTYFIRHKRTGRKYYGVRYKKGCKPEDFFVSYFTSSKVIQNIVMTEGVDSFDVKIHKVFETPDEATVFEERMLRRLNVIGKDDWFNMSITSGAPVFYSKGSKPWNKGISNVKMKGKKFYNNGEIQKMLSEEDVPKGWVKGRLNKPWNSGLTKHDDERMKTNAERAAKGREKSDIANVPWNRGLTKDTDERLMKASRTVISRNEQVKCPYCDVVGATSAMKRHHFNNCRSKT